MSNTKEAILNLSHENALRAAPADILRLRGLEKASHKIRPNQIHCIMASNVDCLILTDNDHFYVHHPLCQLQQLLPEYFFRFHRSFLVNPYHILQVQDYSVEFLDHQQIGLSITKSQYLAEFFQKFREAHQPWPCAEEG